MFNRFIIVFVVALWLLSPAISFSQEKSSRPLYFENYTSEKGLSQNSCYTIEQDKDGFMWFGTQDGLNRYDGKVFKVYLPQNKDGKAMPSNYVSSLFYDKKKELLWVGTVRGVCIYDPSKDRIIDITELYPFADLLKNIDVKKIVSFDDDEYWIITYSKGLVLLKPGEKKLTTFFDDEASKKKVVGIVKHEGRILVALLQQIKLLSRKNNSYLASSFEINHQVPEIKELYSTDQLLWIGTLSSGCIKVKDVFSGNAQVTVIDPQAGGIGCFTSDNGGNIWMGTRGKGILQYKQETERFTYFSNNKYNNFSLGKNFVLSLFKDRQSIIWVGLSGGGVAKYDSLSHQFYTYANNPDNMLSLPDNMIFSLHEAKDGHYYIGTQNKGLVEWLPGTEKFITYATSSKAGIANNTIYDITEDEEGRLWIAGWAGLMQLNTETKKLSYNNEQQILTAKKLYAVHKLKKSDSLFVTGENGMAFFSLKENKWKPCPDSINKKNCIGRFIFEDENQVLWICTIGEGLIRYDYRQNSFRIIETIKKHSFYVRHLIQKNNYFLLATDNGILVYDPAKDNIEKQITLTSTSKSGVCYAIAEDNNGYLWISSNAGLYKMHPVNYNFINYDIGNGLNYLEFNTACVLKEKDGSLLFGGIGGITKFQPGVLQKNTFSPLPVITALYVNDTIWKTPVSITQTKKITLKHRQNFLAIYFAVNNFSSQNKNNYQYRLTGLNNDWVNSSNQNFVNYTALPPGSYTFQLRSANSDGKWSNGFTELQIFIEPPWWQTWWFRAIAFAFTTGLIVFLVQRRIGYIRQQAELKQKIAETEMAALRVQMNPHFIFNSLNSINSFVVENKTHLASDYLTKFSRLIRLILDNSKNESITLEKELETLKLYLLMEQLRFEKKFDYQVTVGENIDEQLIKVPPMIIQPFAENAIWHGLLHQPDKGKLNINIEKKNGVIQFTIEDNGIGLKKSAELKSKNNNTRKSYGLQITEERLQRLNAENNISIIDLANTDNSRTGTKVIITYYNKHV